MGLQQVPEDIGPDPPRGIGVEADVAGHVEFLDGLHQADVPFLDEVHLVGAGMPVFRSDGHRHAQVGQDQFDRRVPAAHDLIFMEELQFFFFGQKRVATDLNEIPAQCRTGNKIRGFGLFRLEIVAGLRNIFRDLFLVLGLDDEFGLKRKIVCF